MTDFNHTFHPSILRAYDIRGTFGAQLVEEDATLLGYKIATYFSNFSSLDQKFTIGIVRDGRHSSPLLHKNLVEALLSCGLHVIDYGIGPSPLGYYASFFEKIDGIVVITASHNPKADNGFKILLRGKNLCGDDLQQFAKLDNAKMAPVRGSYQEKDIVKDYANYSIKGLHGKNCKQNAACRKDIKIAWDFSHGAMGVIHSLIEKNIPGTHFFLCDTLDGDFPSHDPDPTLPKNLALIKECILNNQCDIGFAFDGDGDRLVVVDHKGNSIDGDRLVALLAKDVLAAHPGATILADIKSSYAFAEEIRKFRGNPLLTRTGHSFIKTKMRETSALLAGEMSGHIFFADENKGYDDGFYAACRVLRLLNTTSKCIADLNTEIPFYSSTPEIKIPIPAHLKFELIDQLQHYLRSQKISFIDEDGVRLELEKGWWLLRASNTSEYLILRMEGRNSGDLETVKKHCKDTFLNAFQENIKYFDAYF